MVAVIVIMLRLAPAFREFPTSPPWGLFQSKSKKKRQSKQTKRQRKQTKRHEKLCTCGFFFSFFTICIPPFSDRFLSLSASCLCSVAAACLLPLPSFCFATSTLCVTTSPHLFHFFFVLPYSVHSLIILALLLPVVQERRLEDGEKDRGQHGAHRRGNPVHQVVVKALCAGKKDMR